MKRETTHPPALRRFLLSLPLVAAACAPQAQESQGPTAEGTDADFRHVESTAAAPEAVWALWTDVSSWPEWDTELEAATLDGPMQLGATGTLVPKRGFKSKFEITVWEPPMAYAFTTKLPGGSLTVHRRFLDTGEQTTFEHHVTFEGKSGARWAKRLGPTFRRQLPPVMVGLARLAEATGT